MSDASGMTFWDHLDELRGVIVRMLVVTMLAAVLTLAGVVLSGRR